jgi:ABC-type Fe3+/spermidine/putrescine transport system ATPase subunit
VGTTALYVTHDLVEAFALGNRVAILQQGRIAQVGSPDEVWTQPASEEVARFLGLANVRGGVVIRPEAVSFARVVDGSRAGDGVVEHSRREGSTVRVVVRLDDGGTLVSVAAALDHPQPGDRVAVDVNPAGVVQLG